MLPEQLHIKHIVVWALENVGHFNKSQNNKNQRKVMYLWKDNQK